MNTLQYDPAKPCKVTEDSGMHEYTVHKGGYTKREDIAIKVFNTLIVMNGHPDVDMFDELALNAVNAADTIIRKLNSIEP